MPGQEDKQGSAEGRVVAGEEEGGGVGGERKGRAARVVSPIGREWEHDRDREIQGAAVGEWGW